MASQVEGSKGLNSSQSISSFKSLNQAQNGPPEFPSLASPRCSISIAVASSSVSFTSI